MNLEESSPLSLERSDHTPSRHLQVPPLGGDLVDCNEVKKGDFCAPPILRQHKGKGRPIFSSDIAPLPVDSDRKGQK